MSLPHVLSLSRVLAGPVVALLALARPGNAYLIAALIFALASFTDLLDGKLARYSQSVSPLGIFIDTTSDKVMVGLALIAMGIAGLTPAWVPLVIIGREFLISGLRSYAASCDRIISAHIWGKGKAAITMVAIVAVLVSAGGKYGGVTARSGSHGAWVGLYTASSWLLGVAAILTIISGARYIVDAWPLIRAEPAAVRTNRVDPSARSAAPRDRAV
jgi:CDP-diacylglycerol--glycerol-3-phosphate 3-phosphatidyltransferase